jgi:hypothetical protein
MPERDNEISVARELGGIQATLDGMQKSLDSVLSLCQSNNITLVSHDNRIKSIEIDNSKSTSRWWDMGKIGIAGLLASLIPTIFGWLADALGWQGHKGH